jgi:hypothetical protein
MDVQNIGLIQIGGLLGFLGASRAEGAGFSGCASAWLSSPLSFLPSSISLSLSLPYHFIPVPDHDTPPSLRNHTTTKVPPSPFSEQG